jgi:uncharacterized protein (DUF1778 family)
MTAKKATFALRLPQSLKNAIEKLAEADGVSMNQFLVVAAAEKVSALQTEAYIAERGARADREACLRVLNRWDGTQPEPEDALPGDGAAKQRQ